MKDSAVARSRRSGARPPCDVTPMVRRRLQRQWRKVFFSPILYDVWYPPESREDIEVHA